MYVERLAELIHERRCNWDEADLGYASAEDCWDDPVQHEHREWFRKNAQEMVDLVSAAQGGA